MTTPRFSAVVFDFGGVLITPITDQMADVAAWHGVSMLSMLDVLMGPRETSTADHPWHRAERGELPPPRCRKRSSRGPRRRASRCAAPSTTACCSATSAVIAAWSSASAALRQEGYRTGLLTNSFVEFRPTLEERVDFALFDVVVDSSEAGCRKPEPEIYADHDRADGRAGGGDRLPRRLRRQRGGRRVAGWQTIHVTDSLEALAELDRMLADQPRAASTSGASRSGNDAQSSGD